MPDYIFSPKTLPGLITAPTQAPDASSQNIAVAFIIAIPFLAGATSVPVFVSNAPYKMRILNVDIHVTTAAVQTLTLNNGATAITNAISLNPTVNSVTAAATLNPAQCIVNQGGSVTGALSAAGGAGLLLIRAIKFV